MITRHIITLANAILIAEGWSIVGDPNDNTYLATKSYRNHNPGNLRSSPYMLGRDDNFAYFINDQVGMFALYWDIMKKAQGETSTGLSGKSTIEEFAKIYSASSGEELENYIKTLERYSGFNRRDKLERLLINN